jgi:hypothetical protein
MEHFASINRVKEAYEGLKARMSRVRKESEKTVERALQVVETGGASTGWGYANARWGTVPADDASAPSAIEVMGVPADLGVGLVLIGGSFFGALGRYEEHGYNLGTGSVCAFGYRLGTELGHKAASHAPARTTTRGLGRGANGHTVFEDEREAVFR